MAAPYVLVSIVASDITFSDREFRKRGTSPLGSRNATVADFREQRDGNDPGRGST